MEAIADPCLMGTDRKQEKQRERGENETEVLLLGGTMGRTACLALSDK